MVLESPEWGRAVRSWRGPPPNVRLIGAMPGRSDRVVKGAPFSADVVTETTQTLPDGNHIRQTARAKLYRDSEGRERNEQSLGGLRALVPNSNLPSVIYINDPVSGVDYALNQRDKTATRYTRPTGGRATADQRGQAQGAPFSGGPFAGGRRGRAAGMTARFHKT